MAQGRAACPQSSKVGDGLVELAELGTGDVTMFNSNQETIFLIEFRDSGIRNVNREAAAGRIQTIEIAEGVTLERVELEIDRIRKGGESYVGTPDRCPRKEKWINKGILVYRDGVEQTESKPTRCERRSG